MRSTGDRLIASLAIAATLLSAGCVVDRVDRRGSRYLTPPPEADSGLADVSAEFRWNSLGFVEYDDFSIPLVSPDGVHIAIRGGVPPRWSQILATPDAPITDSAWIRIYELDSEQRLTLRHEAREPWLLGRAANARGFLVEEPRTDGSRRIGRVDWVTGEVNWLVDEGFVDAFATIGEDGTLAWSRRKIDAPAFDLMVRRGDGGGTWKLPARWERSWVDPVLSPDGRTIFMLRRGDGTVELGWTRLVDEQRFQDGVSTHGISVRTTPRRVHAMLGPQVGAASPPGRTASLIFLHPDLGRLVEWRPTGDLARPFPEAVVNAVMIDRNRAVATTTTSTMLAELTDEVGRPPTALTLMDEAAIPRRRGTRAQDLLLFRPSDGRYEILLAELP
ncbi:MAG: hypothetical protein VX672_02765 [Planctomycetota bacterium]|nr:hypothetical protein [Planctomycetota bacterium]